MNKKTLLYDFLDNTCRRFISPPQGSNATEIHLDEYDAIQLIFTGSSDLRFRLGDILDHLRAKRKREAAMNVKDFLFRANLFEIAPRSAEIRNLNGLARSLYLVACEELRRPQDVWNRVKLGMQAIEDKDPVYGKIVLVLFHNQIKLQYTSAEYTYMLRVMSSFQATKLLQQLMEYLEANLASASIKTPAASEAAPKDVGSQEETAAAASPSEPELIGAEEDDWQTKLTEYEFFLIEKEREIAQLEREKSELLRQGNDLAAFTFFKKLADQHVLTNFSYANKLRSEIRKERRSVPEELTSTLASIASFMNVAVSCGLQQVGQIGEIVELAETDIADYQFDVPELTNKFTHAEERKPFRILSPGWKLKDQAILLPNAQEIQKERG